MNKVLWIITLFYFSFGAVAQESKQNNLTEEPPKNLKLFLLIGQSNMAGRGAVASEDQEPIPGVWMLDPYYKWVPAVDPMHFDTEMAGVGLGRSFAKEIVKECPEVQIGLIPCAYGGTSLDFWQPGRHLYRNAVRRAKFAETFGHITGILWHQGESDAASRELSETYGHRWTVMMDSMRKDLDAFDVPVVLGTLGDFVETFREGIKKYSPVVNQQILKLESKKRKIGVANAAGLEHKGDELHFSTEALYELGRRYGRVYLSLEPGFCDER